MSDDRRRQNYPDPTELYRRKEANRKNEATRSVSEKMAAVARLRDFERQLEGIRKANRAKRAAKQIKIGIKTRWQLLTVAVANGVADQIGCETSFVAGKTENSTQRSKCVGSNFWAFGRKLHLQ